MSTSIGHGSGSGNPGTASVSSLVDLPELVQTIATQRRSGTLVINQGKQRRRVFFSSGQVIACSGAPAMTWAKTLCWAEILKPDQLAECLVELGDDFKEMLLVESLQTRGLVNRDALLDAVDCYIEECFSEMVAWAGCQLQFVAKLAADPWAAWQAKMGVSVAPGSMLLEAMRRLDELKSMSAQIPEAWDLMLPEPAAAVPPELGKDEKLLLAACGTGRAAGELLGHAGLPPFRATRALVTLRKHGLLRVGSAAELVVQADSAHAHGQHHQAFGLYRRAVAIGVDSARIHLHIAELAEQLGDQPVAVRSYLTAAGSLGDQGSAVVAIRNALRLGAEREGPLNLLLVIYRQIGERDEAITVLLELAQLYEGRRTLDEAARMVREAQELGADPATCAGILARLARAEGDVDQAVLQLELMARAATASGKSAEAADAYSQLLELSPSRFDYAAPYAELLAGEGRKDEAVRVLRALVENQSGAAEDVQVGTYELLARLNPGDGLAHEWLAKAYQRRKNRDGATEQLKLLAESQEREHNHPVLAATLERILEVGGESVDVLKRLALVYSRLGQEGKANAALSRAVDAALALGQLAEARQMCAVAVDMDPSCLPLRIRMAQIANREGDRATALANFRSAASLARGQGKLDVARAMLLQVRKLRPDDVLVRSELAELALEAHDPESDRILRDLVHHAVRTANFGLAIDRARLRVQLAEGPAWEARDELVELLRRVVDHPAELKAGRELLDDYLVHGEFDRATTLLQRLVASNPRNADLVLQLGELYAALQDERQAQRFYRHGVCLLQLEGRVDEAHKTLDQLAALEHDDEAIALAHDSLTRGQALEWEAIRWNLAQGQRRRLAEEIGAGSGVHAVVPRPPDAVPAG